MKRNQQDCVVPETPLGRTPKTPIGQAPKTPNMRFSQKREKRVLFAGNFSILILSIFITLLFRKIIRFKKKLKCFYHVCQKNSRYNNTPDMIINYHYIFETTTIVE